MNPMNSFKQSDAADDKAPRVIVDLKAEFKVLNPSATRRTLLVNLADFDPDGDGVITEKVSKRHCHSHK